MPLVHLKKKFHALHNEWKKRWYKITLVDIEVYHQIFLYNTWNFHLHSLDTFFSYFKDFSSYL